MICCALAAVMIGHIILAWTAIGDRLRGTSPSSRPAAAAWTFGQASLAKPVRRPKLARAGGLLVIIATLGIFTAAYAGHFVHSRELGNTGIFAPICGGHP